MAVLARMDDLIIIGLEEKNLEKLREGLPFHKHLMDIMGVPFQVVIFYGKTMEDLERMGREMCGPGTVITDQRQMKKN